MHGIGISHIQLAIKLVIFNQKSERNLIVRFFACDNLQNIEKQYNSLRLILLFPKIGRCNMGSKVQSGKLDVTKLSGLRMIIYASQLPLPKGGKVMKISKWFTRILASALAMTLVISSASFVSAKGSDKGSSEQKDHGQSQKEDKSTKNQNQNEDQSTDLQNDTQAQKEDESTNDQSQKEDKSTDKKDEKSPKRR